MSGGTLSDEALWSAFRADGDEHAFEALVERHWPTAYRLAVHCLGDASLAHDMAQDVFVNVARASARFTSQGDFVAWLRTLVLNAVRMHVRARDRRRTRETIAAANRPSHQAPQGERELVAEEVREHVQRLPLSERFAVILAYFQGHTHQEVARALDCPPGTASSRIRRGLQQLEASLTASGFCVSAPVLLALLRDQDRVPVGAPPATASLLAQGAPRAGLLAKAAAVLLVGAVAAGVALAALPQRAPADARPPRPGAPRTQTADVEAPPTGFTVGDDPQQPQAAAPKEPTQQAPEQADADPSPTDEGPVSPAAGMGDVFDRVVRGQVVHAQTQRPLAGVQVDAWGDFEGQGPGTLRMSHAVTDGSGGFEIPLQLVRARDAEFSGAVLLTHADGCAPVLRSVPADQLAELVQLAVSPGAAARLRGRVQTPDGTPQSGVELAVTLRVPAGRTSAGFARYTVRSGVDGRFELAGLVPGEAEVELVGGQGLSGPALTGRSAPEPTELVVEVTSAATLEVTTRGADGAPRSAWLTVTQLSTQALHELFSHGGAGELGDLPPGAYRLEVSFVGPDCPADRTLEVTLRGGQREAVEAFDLRADERGALSCTVTDLKGNPLAGITLWLVAEPGGWERHREATSDAAGVARFAKLPPGTYGLQTLHDLDAAPEALVRVGPGETRTALRTSPRLRVSGVVVDATGAPIAGAELLALTDSLVGGGLWQTDPEGRFRLPPLPSDLTLEVSAPGRRSRTVHVASDATPLRIELEAERVLRVRARAAAPDGTRCVAELDDGGLGEQQSAPVLDGAVEFRFGNLAAAGEGTVTLRVGTTVPVQRAFGVRQAQLDLGALPLATGHTVRGRVVFPPGWAFERGTVHVGGQFAFHRAKLDAHGRFALEGVDDPAFELWISAEGAGAAPSLSTTLRVDPRVLVELGEIRLQLPEPAGESEWDALQVRVSDPAGILGRMGFEDGDLVVGVNGQEFSGPADMEAAFERVFFPNGEPYRGVARLTVLRGKERLDLDVVDFEEQRLRASPEALGGTTGYSKR